MRVIITGAAGMLGKDVVSVLLEDANFQIYPLDIHPVPSANAVTLDITAGKRIVLGKISEIDPDVIVHCAAITNVDACEKNKELTDNLHVEATRILASYKPDSVRFLYISTDSVFDGIKGNYSEEDTPDPQNYYALSKLQGEKAALDVNKYTIVLRTNIYGFHVPHGNSMTEWAIDKLSHQSKISGFTDVDFNPVYTKQLARVIKKVILAKDLPSILNVASKDVISKYDFLIKIANVFGFKKELIGKASVDTSGLNAKRPKHTSLNISKLKKLLKEAPSIELGLEELKTDYNNNLMYNIDT